MIFANLGSRKFTSPNYIYDRKNALLSFYMNVSARVFFFYKKPLLQSYEKKYIKKENPGTNPTIGVGLGRSLLLVELICICLLISKTTNREKGDYEEGRLWSRGKG
jgi:hypothetical protein